jgi:hypothetical protein
MKPYEIKNQFVELRAQGLSFNAIANQLHLSKSTCCKWDKELSKEIDQLKQAELKELYDSYGMTKKARIENLGNTLDKINEALEKADFTKLPASKLLDYKLKYTQALKDEHISEPINLEDISAHSILEALAELLERTRSGDITAEQSQRESIILLNLLKAYDLEDIEKRLSVMESALTTRRS